MVDKKTEKSDPKKDAKALSDYVKKAIETDFPMVKIKKIGEVSLQGVDIVGTFADGEDRIFTFLITQRDPRPILQRL